MTARHRTLPLPRRQRLALVIRPPSALLDAISAIAARPETAADRLPSLSGPHLTLLYAPCQLIEMDRLRRSVELLRQALPLAIHYEGVRVSDHRTVQLLVHPPDAIRALHLHVLDALGLVRHAAGLPSVRLTIFDTINVGSTFSPHVTLGRFTTRARAEAAASVFAALPPSEQRVSEIWIADATAQLDHRLAVRSRAG